MNMKIKMLGSKVLVKTVDTLNVTPGGIYIPTSAKHTYAEGIVKAYGPGNSKVNNETIHGCLCMGIQDGDCVVYNATAGVSIEIEAAPYVVLDIEDIILIRNPTR